MLKIRLISTHLMLFLLIDFPSLTSEDEQVDLYQFHRTEAHCVSPLRLRPDALNRRVRCYPLHHSHAAPSQRSHSGHLHAVTTQGHRCSLALDLLSCCSLYLNLLYMTHPPPPISGVSQLSLMNQLWSTTRMFL